MTAELSDRKTGDHKYACHNRRRDALSSAVIVPDGFKEDGAKRYRTIRTGWNGAASGACRYSLTDEGKGDVRCDGCMRGAQ